MVLSSTIIQSSQKMRVKDSNTLVVGSAYRRGLISAGKIALDDCEIDLKTGDDLKRLQKKIQSSAPHLDVKLKKDGKNSRLVIKTPKSDLRLKDSTGELRKLYKEGVIGNSKNALIQIKSSTGGHVRLVFERKSTPTPRYTNTLTATLYELLAKRKVDSGNFPPYVHKAYMDAAKLNDGQQPAKIEAAKKAEQEMKDAVEEMEVIHKEHEQKQIVRKAALEAAKKAADKADLRNMLEELDALDLDLTKPVPAPEPLHALALVEEEHVPVIASSPKLIPLDDSPEHVMPQPFAKPEDVKVPEKEKPMVTDLEIEKDVDDLDERKKKVGKRPKKKPVVKKENSSPATPRLNMMDRKSKRKSIRSARMAMKKTPVSKLVESEKVMKKESPRIKQLSPERKRYLSFARRMKYRDKALYAFMSDRTQNNRYRAFQRFEEFIEAANSSTFGHKSASIKAIHSMISAVKGKYDMPKYALPFELKGLVKTRLDKLKRGTLTEASFSEPQNLIPIIFAYDSVSLDKSALKTFYTDIGKEMPEKLV